MTTNRQPSGAPLPTDARLARELLDGLAEAVLTTDENGLATLVNAKAAELLPAARVHRWGDRGARRGMFGEARLRAALVSTAGRTPAALIDRVLRAVDDWLDGQAHDDVAMLAVCASAPA
ncbi:SpoIIE family protein phosphatase [Micromonospora sp. M12]